MPRARGRAPYYLWSRPPDGLIHYRLTTGGSWRSTGETEPARAHAYMARLLANRIHQQSPPADVCKPVSVPSELTIRQYTPSFFVWGECDWIRRQLGKHRQLGRMTAAMRRGHLVNHIYPRWGDVPMETLNPVDIETWLAGLPLADGTKNQILYTMVIVVREARRQKRIRLNPLTDVEPMGRTYRHRDALSSDELRQLFPEDLDELVRIWGQPRWALGYLLMATTGIRVGEACAGLWRHVRWDIPAFLVLQAVKADYTVGPPKNRRPRAALLPQRTVEVLTWWRGETPCPLDEDFILPFARKNQLGPVDPKALERAWHPAAARAGIRTAGRFLGAHALRHTYETRMRGKIDELALRYMMGHQGVAMSERYDQAGPEERVLRILGVRASLDAAWSQS